MSERIEPAARARYCVFDTAIGACGVAWSARGLTRLQLPESDREATERRLRAIPARADREGPPPEMEQLMAEIARYLTGERVDFCSVAIDLPDVSPFHRMVFEATRAVGWGQTASYGEVARRAGSPGAARAVGQALSQNPVAIIIPCHRILASGHRVGGFSAYGGVFAKQRLLALEGVRLGGDAPRLPGF